MTPEPSISDEAVRAKTGKDWGEWFAILDTAGGMEMDHKAIVAYLAERYDVGGWWQQMITNTYEVGRGRRQVHEMPGGFEISRSKTLAVPIGRLYNAWDDAGRIEDWLGDPVGEVRETTPGKSIWIEWPDGYSRVNVRFYEKDPEKSQVTVQHTKLADAGEAEAMKRYWSGKLNDLKDYLAGP
jgi:uncharacterized protein YndB with AHSA1/START domain